MMDRDYIVVFVTASSRAEADRIGQTMVQEKLAACVNVIGDVRSLFWWQGKVDQAEEVLLVMKTRLQVFDRLTARVKECHSYDVPEVIALPIIAGEGDYLAWLKESVP